MMNLLFIALPHLALTSDPSTLTLSCTLHLFITANPVWSTNTSSSGLKKKHNNNSCLNLYFCLWSNTPKVYIHPTSLRSPSLKSWSLHSELSNLTFQWSRLPFSTKNCTLRVYRGDRINHFSFLNKLSESWNRKKNRINTLAERIMLKITIFYVIKKKKSLALK